MATSEKTMTKLKELVADYLIHVSEYPTHRDGSYNPIKAFATITLDVEVLGNIKINNISIEQSDEKEPNDLLVKFPGKFNAKREEVFENIVFQDRRIREGLTDLIIGYYNAALDDLEK